MKFKFAFVLVFGALLIAGPDNVGCFKKLKKIKKMMLLAPFVKPFAKPNLHFVVPLSPLKGKPCISGGPSYDPCYEPRPEPYPAYEPPPPPPAPSSSSDPCMPAFQLPSFNLPPLQMPNFPTLQLPSLFPRTRPCPPKPCPQPPPPPPRPIRPNPCPPSSNRPQYGVAPPQPRPVPPQHTPPSYDRPHYEYSEPEEYSYQQNSVNDYDEYSNARRPSPDDFQHVINKYTQQSWREQSEQQQQQQRNQFRGNVGSDGFQQGQKIVTNFDDDEYSVQTHHNQLQNSQKHYNPRQSPIGNTEWKAIKTSRPSAPTKQSPPPSSSSSVSAAELLIEKSVKSPLADVSRGAKSIQQQQQQQHHNHHQQPSHKHPLNILSPVQAIKSKQIERLQQQHEQHEHTFHQQASIIPARAEVVQSAITGTVNGAGQQHHHHQQQQQQQPNYQSQTVEQSTMPY